MVLVVGQWAKAMGVWVCGENELLEKVGQWG